MGKLRRRLKKAGNVLKKYVVPGAASKKDIKKTAKIAIPVVAAVFAGPLVAGYLGAASGGVAAGAISGAVGGAASTAVSGGNLAKNMLIGGALGGGLAYAGNAMSGAPGGATSAEQARALAQESGSAYSLTGSGAAEQARALAQGSGSAYNLAGGTTGGGVGSGGMLKNIGSTLGSPLGGALVSGGMQLAGGYLQGKAAKDAAQTSADAQLEAARIAAESAKFRPVGVTTNFGSSKFQYDDEGNLVGAGYSLSPQLQQQQNRLMGMSDSLLSQYQGAQAATAPMAQTAQSMFNLGQGYLQKSPQEQAAQYMREQQALLAAPRANELADIRARLAAQGRTGFAIGGNAGEMAANPEMAAYYNALRQQDLALASQATQGGMDYAKFGSGMVGYGGDMLTGMYGVQKAAYDPYATAIAGAGGLESMGQNAMDLGINIGAKGTAASTQSGMFLGQGMTNAARTMQDVNQISPWGNALVGAGGMLGNYYNRRPVV